MDTTCAPQIHLAAIHSEAGYNGDTKGLGVLCRQEDFFAGIGEFKNSLNRKSTYATFGWQWHQTAGVFSGVATGYQATPVPIAGAVFTYSGVNLIVIPKIAGYTPLTLEFSYTIPFGKTF